MVMEGGLLFGIPCGDVEPHKSFKKLWFVSLVGPVAYPSKKRTKPFPRTIDSRLPSERTSTSSKSICQKETKKKCRWEAAVPDWPSTNSNKSLGTDRPVGSWGRAASHHSCWKLKSVETPSVLWFKVNPSRSGCSFQTWFVHKETHKIFPTGFQEGPRKTNRSHYTSPPGHSRKRDITHPQPRPTQPRKPKEANTRKPQTQSKPTNPQANLRNPKENPRKKQRPPRKPKRTPQKQQISPPKKNLSPRLLVCCGQSKRWKISSGIQVQVPYKLTSKTTPRRVRWETWGRGENGSLARGTKKIRRLIKGFKDVGRKILVLLFFFKV